MPIQFGKPVGAHADCKELEYISALHQSGRILRHDGSINSDDVVAFLASRHGIIADKQYVEEKLMPGLAGAMDDTPEAPVFDIVEIASILLIPHFLKSARSAQGASTAAAGDDKETTANLFQDVVKMILADIGYSSDTNEPVILNRQLMALILETYGEGDASLEPSVITEMLRAAGVHDDDDDDGEREGIELNAGALMWATTGDIQKYDLNWEHTPTTHYDDALDGTVLANSESIKHTTPSQNLSSNPDEVDDKDAENAKVDDLNKSISFQQDGKDKLKTVYTMSTIDYVAENYRSKTFNIILWVLTIMAYFAYSLELESTVGKQDCTKWGSDMGCRIVNSILLWLFIFLQLSIIGTTFISLASAGNSIYLSRGLFSLVSILVGIATIGTACIGSYFYEIRFFFLETYKQDGDEYQFLYISVLVLGCVLLLFQFQALLNVLVPDSAWKWMPDRVKEILLVPGMAKAERSTKRAAAFKIDRMVENALGHHKASQHMLSDPDAASRMKVRASSNLGAFGQAMIHFHATSDFREPHGGIFYTFKRFWSGSLFKEEGVWIHSRLYAMNITHWCVAIFYFVGYFVLLRTLEDIFYGTSSVSPAPSMSPTAGQQRFLQEGADWIPSKAQLRFSVTAGFLVAFFATAGLAAVLLPSSVSTILQFRCGALGSLHQQTFKALRLAPDLTTSLFGSAFWGVLSMSGFIFLSVGALAFFLVLDLTRRIVIFVVSQVIGLAVTITAKVVILLFVRRTLFQGFFKKRPLGGNITLLVLECWSLGITIGTTALRMISLILVSAFYIGRLDTPLLAEGVGNIGPIPIDALPIQFHKDLVLHDAHRHPYMERLGVMYLLKLKYGDDFCSRSGGAWRLIVVLALMPWLRRYRLDDDINQPDDDDDAGGKTNRVSNDVNEVDYPFNDPGASSFGAVEGGDDGGKKYREATKTADLKTLRQYVDHVEKAMEKKLGNSAADDILNQIAQDLWS